MKSVITLLTTVLLSSLASAAQNNLENGYEYVDLGLPSGAMWATKNIGSHSPVDIGDYYSWGEVETKDSYTKNTYKWGVCDTEEHVLKYNDTDKKTRLDPEDDVAKVKWGGRWRMPTKEEFEELLNTCEVNFVAYPDDSSYKVYEVKGPNGNAIYFHLCGYMTMDKVRDYNQRAYFWSSDLNQVKSVIGFIPNERAIEFCLYNDGRKWVGKTSRYMGNPVRPMFLPQVSTGVDQTAIASDFTYKVVCGGIVCDSDFTIYDISGRDVTSQNGSLSGLYILKVGAVAKKVIVAQ